MLTHCFVLLMLLKIVGELGRKLRESNPWETKLEVSNDTKSKMDSTVTTSPLTLMYISLSLRVSISKLKMMALLVSGPVSVLWTNLMTALLRSARVATNNSWQSTDSKKSHGLKDTCFQVATNTATRSWSWELTHTGHSGVTRPGRVTTKIHNHVAVCYVSDRSSSLRTKWASEIVCVGCLSMPERRLVCVPKCNRCRVWYLECVDKTWNRFAVLIMLLCAHPILNVRRACDRCNFNLLSVRSMSGKAATYK